MNNVLAKLKENVKTRDLRYRPIGYSKVLTNRMTITGWRMYKQNHRLHLGFIIYRLKVDFGFTNWEIANFTGIPVRNVQELMYKIRPLLNSDILKSMSELEYEYDKKEHEWRSLHTSAGLPQGYYVIKDFEAWYNGSRWEKPDITFGEKTEKEQLSKLHHEKTEETI